MNYEELKTYLKEIAAKFVIQYVAEQDQGKAINALFLVLDSVWADSRDDAREEGVKEGYDQAITILQDNR